MAEAAKIAREGRLDEDAVVAALQAGDGRLAAALLATAAAVPVSVVDRVVFLRSDKGLVSLVWKAGFSMRLAAPLQVGLAHLAPDATLVPAPDGGFPLAVEEMRWQLDFMRRVGR